MITVRCSGEAGARGCRSVVVCRRDRRLAESGGSERGANLAKAAAEERQARGAAIGGIQDAVPPDPQLAPTPGHPTPCVAQDPHRGGPEVAQRDQPETPGVSLGWAPSATHRVMNGGPD